MSRPTIFALALVAASALIPATSLSDDLAPTAASNAVSPSASATNPSISHLSNMELPRLGQALHATHSAKVLALVRPRRRALAPHHLRTPTSHVSRSTWRAHLRVPTSKS